MVLSLLEILPQALQLSQEQSRGDIDVQGPVVVDTSAVVMGNIKSRSVQINNGAVIEGFCSQCYADIDVESLLERINNEESIFKIKWTCREKKQVLMSRP